MISVDITLREKRVIITDAPIIKYRSIFVVAKDSDENSSLDEDAVIVHEDGTETKPKTTDIPPYSKFSNPSLNIANIIQNIFLLKMDKGSGIEDMRNSEFITTIRVPHINEVNPENPTSYKSADDTVEGTTWNSMVSGGELINYTYDEIQDGSIDPANEGLLSDMSIDYSDTIEGYYVSSFLVREFDSLREAQLFSREIQKAVNDFTENFKNTNTTFSTVYDNTFTLGRESFSFGGS